MEEVSDQKLLLSWFQPGANSPFSPCIYNLQAALLPLDSERCKARLVALHLYRLSRAVHTVRIFATPWLQARQITAIMQGTRREGILLWDSRTMIFRWVSYTYNVFIEWQQCLENHKRCHSARNAFSSFMVSKLLLKTKWMDYQKNNEAIIKT